MILQNIELNWITMWKSYGRADDNEDGDYKMANSNIVFRTMWTKQKLYSPNPAAIDLGTFRTERNTSYVQAIFHRIFWYFF